jgi:predicted small lipoprotein YifL
MGLRRVLSSFAVAGIVAGLTACGGEEPQTHSASDKASGMTVSIAGDQVTLKRTSSSASGTAGAAGQISCTDDYTKLVAAKAQPAPSQPWYAATLITWPDKAKTTTATLSHELTGEPDLCIAQSSDQQTSVVMYFNPDIKAKIEKQQTDTARQQQAGQADAAVKGAAQAAVQAAAAGGKFPETAALVQALTAQGLYVKAADTKAAATETGTIYVIGEDTTDKQLVLAIKAADGKVTTLTQKTTGDPKVSTDG